MKHSFLGCLTIDHQRYDNVSSLLEALELGKIEGAVADDAVLRYMIGAGREKGRYQALEVLPYRLEKQNYVELGEDERQILIPEEDEGR